MYFVLISKFLMFQRASYHYIYKGGPPKLEFIYKNVCIYSYIFEFQSPSKYSLFDSIHLLRHVFPLLKTVFELVNYDAF